VVTNTSMASAVSSVQNFYPDDADNKSLLNTGNHLLDCTLS